MPPVGAKMGGNPNGPSAGGLAGGGNSAKKAQEQLKKAKEEAGFATGNEPVTAKNKRPGQTPAGQLPAGINPLKNTVVNKQSYEATAANIGTLAGGAIVGAALPGPTALGTVVGEATGLTDALGLGFEKPTGVVGSHEYDSANLSGTQGQVAAGKTPSTLGTNNQVSSLQDQNKKKKAKPGISLLQGAGGTLLGT